MHTEAAQRAAAKLKTALDDRRGWIRAAAEQVLAKVQAPGEHAPVGQPRPLTLATKPE